MGKGLREIARRVLRGTRASEHVYHYTSHAGLEGIRLRCRIQPSRRFTSHGPGVYLTDLAPAPDRLAISTALWNRWNYVGMQAYVRVLYDPDDMEQVAEHIWIVRDAPLFVAGHDIVLGEWTGTHFEDERDVGDWTAEPFTGCNPPPDELLS